MHEKYQSFLLFLTIDEVVILGRTLELYVASCNYKIIVYVDYDISCNAGKIKMF